MADWDWSPPPGGQPPGASLGPPGGDLGPADGLDIGWPEWLGGADAPVALDEPPVAPEAPPEAAPPGEVPAEPAPAEDALAGAATPLGLVGRMPWEQAAPDEPAVDALAAPPEPAPELPDALTGGTPEAVADPYADPYAPQEADASYTPEAAERYRIQHLDPVSFAGELAQRDAEWRDREAKLREEYLAEDRRRRRENEELAARVRDEARRETEAIRADAAELAQAGIDTDRFWSTRSTPQKIAAGISVLVGGFMAPHYGGRNTALEYLQGLVEQDIAAQRENLRGRRDALNMRRGLVGDLVDLGMDEYRAAEVARQAAYQAIDLNLAVEQAKYEQGGTTALRIDGARRAAAAAMQQAAAAAEKERFERNVKIAQERRADANLAENIRSRRSANARAAAQLQWEREKYGLDQKAKAAEAEAKRKAEQRPLQIGQPGELVNKDGSPFTAASTTARERLALQKAATDTMGDLITRIVDDRRKFGWGSDLVKSGETRRMKANLAALMLAAKDAAKLGALSGPDIELVEKFIGTGDPTEIRDPTEGLLTAQRNFELGFDKALRAEGYTGPEYEARVSQDVALMRAGQRAEAESREFERRIGMTEAELAKDYEQHVTRAKRDGVEPMSKRDFAAEAERQWTETQRSMQKREERSRGADADSALYDTRRGQQF